MQTEEQRRLLGAFVRARREALSPDTPGTRRRTPGLRREELAARAGIGSTWCAWIEQGRDVRPSAETLARLAEALHLTRAERAYLFELAVRHDPENPFAGTADADAAPPSLAALARMLPCPAYGLDPAWNIVCWNDAARRLFVGLERAEASPDLRPPNLLGPNLLRYVIMADAAKALIPDWEARAARIVAEFRADFGRNPADPRAQAMVEWLSAHSPYFRQAWQAQAVLARAGGERTFDHPADGPLQFVQHTLHPAERADFKLVVLEPVEIESRPVRK